MNSRVQLIVDNQTVGTPTGLSATPASKNTIAALQNVYGHFTNLYQQVHHQFTLALLSKLNLLNESALRDLDPEAYAWLQNQPFIASRDRLENLDDINILFEAVAMGLARESSTIKLALIAYRKAHFSLDTAQQNEFAGLPLLAFARQATLGLAEAKYRNDFAMGGDGVVKVRGGIHTGHGDPRMRGIPVISPDYLSEVTNPKDLITMLKNAYQTIMRKGEKPLWQELIHDNNRQLALNEALAAIYRHPRPEPEPEPDTLAE